MDTAAEYREEAMNNAYSRRYLRMPLFDSLEPSAFVALSVKSRCGAQLVMVKRKWQRGGNFLLRVYCAVSDYVIHAWQRRGFGEGIQCGDSGEVQDIPYGMQLAPAAVSHARVSRPWWITSRPRASHFDSSKVRKFRPQPTSVAISPYLSERREAISAMSKVKGVATTRISPVIEPSTPLMML